MAETVNYAFLKARAYLNTYTEDGTIIPEADVIDMQKKAILHADTAQKKLYRLTKLDSTKDKPDKLTLITDEFEINDLGIEAVALFIAAKLAAFINKELVNYYDGEYENMVQEIIKNSSVTFEDITDVYTGGDE